MRLFLVSVGLFVTTTAAGCYGPGLPSEYAYSSGYAAPGGPALNLRLGFGPPPGPGIGSGGSGPGACGPTCAPAAPACPSTAPCAAVPPAPIAPAQYIPVAPTPVMPMSFAGPSPFSWANAIRQSLEMRRTIRKLEDVEEEYQDLQRLIRRRNLSSRQSLALQSALRRIEHSGQGSVHGQGGMHSAFGCRECMEAMSLGGADAGYECETCFADSGGFEEYADASMGYDCPHCAVEYGDDMSSEWDAMPADTYFPETVPHDASMDYPMGAPMMQVPAEPSLQPYPATTVGPSVPQAAPPAAPAALPPARRSMPVPQSPQPERTQSDDPNDVLVPMPLPDSEFKKPVKNPGTTIPIETSTMYLHQQHQHYTPTAKRRRGGRGLSPIMQTTLRR